MKKPCPLLVGIDPFLVPHDNMTCLWHVVLFFANSWQLFLYVLLCKLHSGGACHIGVVVHVIAVEIPRSMNAANVCIATNFIPAI